MSIATKLYTTTVQMPSINGTDIVMTIGLTISPKWFIARVKPVLVVGIDVLSVGQPHEVFVQLLSQ